MYTKIQNFKNSFLRTGGEGVFISNTSQLKTVIDDYSKPLYELSLNAQIKFQASKHKFGTIKHYLHCKSEWVRLNTLKDKLEKRYLNTIDYEIADVHLILERYNSTYKFLSSEDLTLKSCF